jgi:ABC-type lipoprotein export system ATPase subunit
LLVAAEPTGNLDSASATSVFDLFDRLIVRGKTVLMVTHDKDLAGRVPRQIEIHDGRITRDGYPNAHSEISDPKWV